MIYGYIRVSSISQNIDKQMEEMKKNNIEMDNIFIDKQSGKNFERSEYQKMISILKEDDLVIVKSIDRLGRNYSMIVEEWARITKTIRANVVVIDMPLLDTRVTPDNLIGRFISDLVLQLLSFIAENERGNIRSRQAEGIKIAKIKGIKFGRPSIILSSKMIEVINKYKNHQINNLEATKLLGISKGTFFKLIKDYNDNIEMNNN